jgi:hypothetical protein
MTRFEVEQMSRRAGVAGRRHGQRCSWKIALLAATTVAVAACGDDSASTRPPDVPEDPEAVVVQFSTGGGIAGPCCEPWDVPDLTAYGDGRVLVEDTAGEVPGLRQATISRSDLAELLAGARDAGLLEAQPPETGTLCCDLGYTRVVIAEAERTHEFEVVGLGHEGNLNSDLSDEQVNARQAVSSLRDRLLALTEQNGTSRFQPAELAIYPSVSTADPSESAPWPLDQALAGTGSSAGDDSGCLLLTDQSDVGAVIAAAEGNPGHQWSSAGQVWWVSVRPLLPHERGCP